MRISCCGVIVTTTMLLTPAVVQPVSAQTRPALPTFYGDTGLWFVPSAETLPPGKFSASVYRANFDRPQGLTDVANHSLTGAVGVTSRIEVFGSWGVVRLRRNARGPFFTPSDAAYGGVGQEHPFLRDPWSKNVGGPLYFGGKVNLLSQSRTDGVGLAVRGIAKVPLNGPASAGTDTAGGQLDLIASRELGQQVEITGTVGGVFRRSPDQFNLSNGIAWGVGAQFPSRSKLRAVVEYAGERPTSDSVEVRGGPFAAADGSLAPTLSDTHSLADLKFGAVWQATNGLFVHGGANYSRDVGDRTIGEQALKHSGWEFDIRFGFHPRAAVFVPPPPPPAPPPPFKPAPVAAPPANRNPTVSAMCDPCSIEVGQTLQLRATGADPDGEAVTYRWTAPAGTFGSATAANTGWTAPAQAGAVPATVTATDARGGQASATVTLQVTKPPVKTYTFDDVHFDFDLYNLKPEAVRVLDEAVMTLNAGTQLRVVIEGHCDSTGTAEYNLALGERRAVAARDYLISRGIAASRLDTISFGEERPKADNTTAEGRAMNRRAALVVRIE